MTVAAGKLWRNKIFALLLVLVFFMHLASFLIVPIFPIFLKKARALSLGQVGIILGVGSIAYQAGSLLGGPLSDRLGRRSIMLAGALLQAVAMLGYHYSDSYAALLFFSGVNGLGVGFLAPTIKALLADTVDNTQRTAAFSWRGIFAHLGIIIAGLTITWMTTKDLYPFVLASIVFLLLAAGILFTLPNDRCVGPDCKRTPLSEYRHIFRHRSFLLFSGLSLLIWAFYAQFTLVLPLRGEYVLHSAHLIGLIWTINSVSVVLLQGLISRCASENQSVFIARCGNPDDRRRFVRHRVRGPLCHAERCCRPVHHRGNASDACAGQPRRSLCQRGMAGGVFRDCQLCIGYRHRHRHNCWRHTRRAIGRGQEPLSVGGVRHYDNHSRCRYGIVRSLRHAASQAGKRGRRADPVPFYA